MLLGEPDRWINGEVFAQSVRADQTNLPLNKGLICRAYDLKLPVSKLPQMCHPLGSFDDKPMADFEKRILNRVRPPCQPKAPSK